MYTINYVHLTKGSIYDEVHRNWPLLKSVCHVVFDRTQFIVFSKLYKFLCGRDIDTLESRNVGLFNVIERIE